jgi:hypothetical protein
MADQDRQFFSRRKWLGLASTSAIAAAAGPGLLPATGSAAGLASPALAGNAGVRIYDVRDFGAVGDSKTLNTAAVQAAVDACFKDGGGTVLVPAGVFQIGMIELKSNVTLRIAAGGTLLGTADGKQYHNVDAVPLSGDSTLGDGNVGLIYAVHAENVTVEGPGTIDGQGAQFRSPTRGEPSPSGIGGSHRPYHLMFYQCQNLRVRDIFLKDSAFHSMRIVQCTFAWFDGIRVHSRVNHNNDGFHFISCQYVHVSSCDIQCQDDACALFGSCKFVTVTDSSFSTRWSVFRFGGGEAENITVSNCIINMVFGCPVKMQCGGRSRFENMIFSNLVMNNVTGPISISAGPRGRGRRSPGTLGGETNALAGEASGTNTISSMDTNSLSNARTNMPGGFSTPLTPEELEQPPGIVRNISFSNIRATVVKPFQLPDCDFTSNYNPGEVFSCIGLNAVGAGFLENISFNDVHVIFPGGGTAEQAAVRDVPKIIGEYYAAGVFPAYALYARNVRGLTLNNVRFELAASDLRPAVVFDHVSDAAVNGLNVQGDKDAESVLRFIDSQDVLLSATRLLTPAPVFLQVEGTASAGIILDGGDLSKANKPLAFRNGAKAEAIKLRG